MNSENCLIPLTHFQRFHLALAKSPPSVLKKFRREEKFVPFDVFGSVSLRLKRFQITCPHLPALVREYGESSNLAHD
jgi:hypothetical protein